MTFPSSGLAPLAGRDLADYGVARLRDQAFDAVRKLWHKRRLHGVTQKDLATAIGRDPGWVSRNLRAPGNWTLRTFGELVQALGGEAEINVLPQEDPPETPANFDAYMPYSSRTGSGRSPFLVTELSNPVIATVSIKQEGAPDIRVGGLQLSVEVIP